MQRYWALAQLAGANAVWAFLISRDVHLQTCIQETFPVDSRWRYDCIIIIEKQSVGIQIHSSAVSFSCWCIGTSFHLPSMSYFFISPQTLSLPSNLQGVRSHSALPRHVAMPSCCDIYEKVHRG